MLSNGVAATDERSIGGEDPALAGGGETGALIRAYDWTETPLGAPLEWPVALKTLVGVMLGSNQPMFVAWGPERTLIYNDAYVDILAGKHPALGEDLLDVWQEIRADLLPIVEQAYGGVPVQSDDIELWMERKGFREEAHFAFSYTPVRDEAGLISGFFCACQETTESVLAKRALKESEARARADAQRVQLALSAGAIIGTWFWDLKSDRFTIDEQFARSFGIDPSRIDDGLSLDEVVETVHPDDKPGLAAAIEEVVERGGHYAHQYRVRRADGGYYWIEANGRVDKDDDGQAVSFPGVLIDIESRRRIEAERDRASALLKTFAEAVPGVVYAKDRQGRMLMANRGTTALIGKPPEDYLGRTDAEFLDDKEQASAVMANDERIMQSGLPEQVEEEVSLPDGTRAFWFSTKAPLYDDAGEVVGLIGSSIDITARKQAEAALADSEERFRFALDAAGGIGTWDWDVPTNKVTTSEHFARMYGLDPERAARGLPVDEYVKGIHPDDQPEVQKRIAEAVRTARDYRAEYRIVDHDGQVHWVIARGRCLTDEAGNPTRFPGVTFDITDRRVAEDRLRELNETLERRVEQAIAEREQAEEALRQSQKMEAVGQLTGGIAHDFNNLLTVVTGNIDMASRTLAAAGLAEGRLKRSLDNAMKGAERAAALTQRLLAFSRRQPLDPKPVDADRLVAGMSDLLHRSLGETISLEVVTTPGLWRVEADPNQLEAAILNLAVNARDAMPDGGRLTIETANALLDEAYAADHAEVAPGHYVMIAVTDTGTGMSKDVAARVFEPFFTTKEVGRGTGLGLSQVYGFTKQSGGHVNIYSEEGSGTTVKLYLPRLITEAEAEQASVAAIAEPSRSQERILVAEDDDDVRAYTVECLRELGYRVLEAHDGQSALRLFERQEEPIDLLFTDVVMPEMTGRELADRARQLQPDLKVLYTSGYTRDAIVHGGRLDEGVEMISKPFTYATLAEKVADVIDQGRTNRVLLVEPDSTLRMFAVEALNGHGYAVDEAASAAEALSRVRAARGRYDAMLLDVDLPDKDGERTAAEVRALFADLPILLAGERPSAKVVKLAQDRCTGLIEKPYNAARLTGALNALTGSCRDESAFRPR